MLKKFGYVAVAASLLTASMVTTSQEAQAHRRGVGVAGAVAGTIIGLGVLGAYAHSRERVYTRSCYEGRQRCEVVGQRCWYNRYGEYRCKDDVRCYRPTHCD